MFIRSQRADLFGWMKICKSAWAKTSFDNMSWFERASLPSNLSKKFEHAGRVQVHRVYLNDPSLESLDFGCFHVPRGPRCMLHADYSHYAVSSSPALSFVQRAGDLEPRHLTSFSCQSAFLHCIQMLLYIWLWKFWDIQLCSPICTSIRHRTHTCYILCTSTCLKA